jgi:hypothetical protein
MLKQEGRTEKEESEFKAELYLEPTLDQVKPKVKMMVNINK